MEYDKAFYEKILRSYFGNADVTVHSVFEERATAKGENFLSSMLRVWIEFSGASSFANDARCSLKETRSFILKHEPTDDPKLLSMIHGQELFTTELKVLGDLLPPMEALLGCRLGPRLVYGSDDPPRAIIMEDLTPEGFRVKDRRRGLSMAHAKLAIKKLAKFHAGSVALFEENPELLRSFKQGVFSSMTHPNFYVLTANSLARLSEEAKTWSDDDCALAGEKIAALVDSVKDRVQKVYNYDSDEFCVLNHGDAWTNNMLFVEDESGRPLEQVFVDYQMSCFSSPAVDLLYFLGINPAPELRGEGEEELLDIYLETLTISMEILECKTQPPTLTRLKEAMHRRRVYALVSGLFLLPRMMLPEEDIETMDELIRHGTTGVDVYGKPEIVSLMKRMLPLMNERGYLDP